MRNNSSCDIAACHATHPIDPCSVGRHIAFLLKKKRSKKRKKSCILHKCQLYRIISCSEADAFWGGLLWVLWAVCSGHWKYLWCQIESQPRSASFCMFNFAYFPQFCRCGCMKSETLHKEGFQQRKEHFCYKFQRFQWSLAVNHVSTL